MTKYYKWKNNDNQNHVYQVKPDSTLSLMPKKKPS